MRDDVEVDTEGGESVLLHSYWTNVEEQVYTLSVLYKEESQSWRESQSNKK